PPIVGQSSRRARAPTITSMWPSGEAPTPPPSWHCFSDGCSAALATAISALGEQASPLLMPVASDPPPVTTGRFLSLATEAPLPRGFFCCPLLSSVSCSQLISLTLSGASTCTARWCRAGRCRRMAHGLCRYEPDLLHVVGCTRRPAENGDSP